MKNFIKVITFVLFFGLTNFGFVGAKIASADTTCPPISQVYFSDASTMVAGHQSVILHIINSYWTASIPGASWIWSEEPLTDAVNSVTNVFTKTFTISGTPAASDMQIAADDLYNVVVNGHDVYTGKADGWNFRDVDQAQFSIPAADLVTGTNTITFTVKNMAMEGGTQAKNPAGLLYKLTVNSIPNCTPTPYPLTLTKTGLGDGTLTPSPLDANNTACAIGECNHDKGQASKTASYAPGTVVTFTAVPDSNSVIGGWAIGGVTNATCGISSTCSLTLNSSNFVEVQFMPKTVVTPPISSTLTITAHSVGGDATFGMVGFLVGGDFDITTVNGTGSKTFNNLTPGLYDVTVRQLPPGWDITTFTCSSHIVVTAGANTTCVFTFTKQAAQPSKYSLALFKSGNGDGTLTPSPLDANGTFCNIGECNQHKSQPSKTAYYAPGTVLTFTAVPDANSVIAGWTIGGQGNSSCGTSSTCSLTLNISNFAEVQFSPKTNGGGGPTNASPIANAGPDQTITSPNNSVTLNGGASTDSDGTIASYTWTFVSGPSTIDPADTVSPLINGLVVGTYVFQLTVTDNAGATGSDTVQITVNPASGGPTGGGGLTSSQCSDGIDNDGDALIDQNDPGCHSDSNVNNPSSYTPTDNDESNTSPQCSDGKDNDNDGKIDSLDPECHTDGNPTNTSSYNPSLNNEAGTTTTGGGGGPIINNNNGQVLGASTTCGIYVDKYLKMGRKNNPETVKKVQSFLNDYMKAGLKVDGIFGIQTDKYVRIFQAQHKVNVLDPWGLKGPTGIVYLTTTTEINNIVCPPLNLPIPTNLIPIEANPSFPPLI